MLIEWLVPIKTATIQKLQESNLASVRLRAAVGAKALSAIGAENQFTDGFKAQTPDVVIVGKIDNVSDPARSQRWLNRLIALKNNSETKVLIDYTDNHLASNSENAKFYKGALKLADQVICSSDMLAQHVKQSYTGHISIIPDPIEVAIQAPLKKKNTTPTALWFGHATNLPYLFDFLLNTYTFQKSARLILMTNLYPFPPQLNDLLNSRNLRDLEINVIPWSREDLIRASALADVCWIPAGVADVRKNGASSNRLITAIALGLPTAADNLDSYLPLQTYYSNIRKNEAYFQFENPEKYHDNLKNGQLIIEKQYTKQNIKKQWVSVIQQKLYSKSFLNEHLKSCAICDE
jgi:hypothetical protein